MTDKATEDELPERINSRQIIQKISDAAIEFAFTRHELTTSEYEAAGYADVEIGVEAFKSLVEEVKADVLACLTGDETGCLDPEDVDFDNELEWLTRRLTRAPSTDVAAAELPERIMLHAANGSAHEYVHAPSASVAHGFGGRHLKDFLFENCHHNRDRNYDLCPVCIAEYVDLLATPSSTEIEIRNRALEEAARACDDLRAIRPTTERGLLIATECAIAIRALAVSNSESGDGR